MATAKIDKDGSLDRFGSQVAPQVVPGALRYERRVIYFRHFSRKCRLKGRFCDPLKIENGSKITLVRLGRNFDPPKMPSGSEKTREFNENTIDKSLISVAYGNIPAPGLRTVCAAAV